MPQTTSGFVSVFSALARQNAYANNILFQEALKLGVEELARTLSPSRESAYQLLIHLVAVEFNYLRQMREGDGEKLDMEATKSLPDFALVATAHGERFLEFVTALTEDDFVRLVTFEFSTGARLVYPIWQLLTQTFMHSTQHRGELSILLSELGHPLPIDDIIVQLTADSGQTWPFKGK